MVKQISMLILIMSGEAERKWKEGKAANLIKIRYESIAPKIY
jgi:hypothetical protein